MTKLVSLLSICAFICSSAFAVTVEYDGMGRVRSSSTKNYDLDDDGKDENKKTSYRFQVGFKITKSEATSIYIQPRFNKVAGDTTSGQSSGALKDADGFDMHQAFITHKFSDFSLKAGRQELAYGDQLLIGSVPWHDVGRSFDGYKLSYNSKYGVTDLLYMTVKENGVESDSDRDHDLQGIYHSGEFGSIKDIDLYYLVDQDLTNKTSDNDIKVSTAGIRVKTNMDKFDYRVEYASQDIKFHSTSKTATQYNLEVGYKIKKLRVAVEFARADEDYRQLYPTGHKWLGMSDFFKRANIEQLAAHFKYSFSEKLKTSLSYHTFKVVKKSSNAHKWMYTAAEDTSEDELGSEIDLVATYAIEKDMSVQVGYSIFQAGKRFKEANNDDNSAFSYLQLVSKF